ncbi:MAG: ferritin family protein [Candidatus Eisenbacteria bacterium]|nr:ferritin family protein [Candidatus Eisenbacteria bacterium]
MQRPTTDRERVDFALRTERDGHEFYQMAAKKTAHKLAKAAFELLSREELRHVALIEALDKGLAGKDKSPEAEEVTLKSLESSLKSIYGSASEETGDVKFEAADAYQKAIELEKRITSLYTDYMMESDDEGARRLFAVLQKEEQHHLSLLQDMHSYLTKPGEWFVDRDGVMLDGG